MAGTTRLAEPHPYRKPDSRPADVGRGGMGCGIRPLTVPAPRP